MNGFSTSLKSLGLVIKQFFNISERLSVYRQPEYILYSFGGYEITITIKESQDLIYQNRPENLKEWSNYDIVVLISLKSTGEIFEATVWPDGLHISLSQAYDFMFKTSFDDFVELYVGPFGQRRLRSYTAGQRLQALRLQTFLQKLAHFKKKK